MGFVQRKAMQEGRKSKLVVVSGPSGVGKSTICRAVVQRMEDVALSVSVTTRPKARGEVEGKDYWFVSREEFQRRVNEGLLLEHAEVFGNLYGTPSDKVEQSLKKGVTVILEIDVQGGRQVKAVHPDAVMMFILPPSEKDLEQRMNHRARDDAATAERRLGEASSEIAAAWRYYEYMVINDDLETAIKEVINIIEMCRRS